VQYVLRVPIRHVSRLRRLACLYITDPGLPPWASFCRAYGARAIVTLMGEWSICRLAGLASACPLAFTDAMQCASETTMSASPGVREDAQYAQRTSAVGAAYS